MFELELEQQEALLGKDRPELTEVLTDLAAVYTHWEEYDMVHSLLEKVIGIAEAHFGPDRLAVAHALTDLAVLPMEEAALFESSADR